MPPRDPSRTGHHRRPTGDHRASRFSRMEIPRMPGFSDRAGSAGHSHNATVDLAFRLVVRRRHPELVLRGSIARLRVPLSTLRRRPHERQRMTRSHRGSLLLRCRALSSPSPCRFIPAHTTPTGPTQHSAGSHPPNTQPSRQRTTKTNQNTHSPWTPHRGPVKRIIDGRGAGHGTE
jgi:hypothetical protein